MTNNSRHASSTLTSLYPFPSTCLWLIRRHVIIESTCTLCPWLIQGQLMHHSFVLRPAYSVDYDILDPDPDPSPPRFNVPIHILTHVSSLIHTETFATISATGMLSHPSLYHSIFPIEHFSVRLSTSTELLAPSHDRLMLLSFTSMYPSRLIYYPYIDYQPHLDAFYIQTSIDVCM
jgi:hypothetical protein